MIMSFAYSTFSVLCSTATPKTFYTLKVRRLTLEPYQVFRCFAKRRAEVWFNAGYGYLHDHRQELCRPREGVGGVLFGASPRADVLRARHRRHRGLHRRLLRTVRAGNTGPVRHRRLRAPGGALRRARALYRREALVARAPARGARPRADRLPGSGYPGLRQAGRDRRADPRARARPDPPHHHSPPPRREETLRGGHPDLGHLQPR